MSEVLDGPYSAGANFPELPHWETRVPMRQFSRTVRGVGAVPPPTLELSEGITFEALLALPPMLEAEDELRRTGVRPKPALSFEEYDSLIGRLFERIIDPDTGKERLTVTEDVLVRAGPDTFLGKIVFSRLKLTVWGHYTEPSRQELPPAPEDPGAAQAT